jgi:hypothetical protein
VLDAGYMTVEKLAAHARMLAQRKGLRRRKVVSDEWLDDPCNWEEKKRPLTPSEKEYLWRINDPS